MNILTTEEVQDLLKLNNWNGKKRNLKEKLLKQKEKEVQIMFKGIVKWFNSQKGYGFITSEGKDIFVHYTGIEAEGYKSLTERQNVVFDTVDSEKGVQAINVVVVA